MVSVIMPFFNTDIALTRRALENVAAQGVAELEVVIVDDGSEAESHRELARLVDEFASRLDLRLLTQPNAGPGAARNRAVEASRFELIAPLDSDDYWLPGKLRTELDLLAQDPSLWLVCGGMAVDDTEGRRLKERWGPSRVEAFGRGRERLYLSLLSTNSVNHSTVCFRREGFRAVGGYDESLPNAQDWELWLRACRAGLAMRYVDVPMAVQVYHDRNISRQGARRRPANRRVLERELADLPAFLSALPPAEVRPVVAAAWLRLGRLLARAGRRREARRAFAASFLLRPTVRAGGRWLSAALTPLAGAKDGAGEP